MQKLVWQNANGVELDLTSGNYGITEWEGFSNTSLNIQQQQVPFQDGGVFLDALIEQRELSVTLAMQDNNNLELRYQLRRELISALNPKLGEGYLIYTNDYISKRIKCVPQIPLFETHNSDTVGTPKASLSWTACEPYWEDLEDTETIFDIREQPILKNEGDVCCYPKIEFFTNEVSNPEIKNKATDKIIKYNGILNKNLLINTEIGKKSVLAENIKIENKFVNISNFLGRFIKCKDGYLLLVSDSLLKTRDFTSYECIYQNQDDIVYLTSIASDGEETIVIAGYKDQNPYIVTSSNGGRTWTTQILSNYQSSARDVVYFKNYFFINCSPVAILKSSDGISWGDVVLPENRNGEFIKNDLILGVIGDENGGLKTTDGTNWVTINSPQDYFGTHYIFIEYKNTFYKWNVTNVGYVEKSTDIENWETVWLGNNYKVLTIAYSNKLQTISILCWNEDDNSERVIFTIDKDNNVVLTDKTFSFPLQQSTLFYYDEGGFFIGYNNGTVHSYNGLDWDYESFPFTIRYISPIGDKIIVSGNGSNKIAYCVNNNKFNDWVFSEGITTSYNGKVASIEKTDIYIFGAYQNIFISSDCKNWIVARQVSGDITYNQFIYDKRLQCVFGACTSGSNGFVVKSEDGVDWSAQSPSIGECGGLLSVATDNNSIIIFVGLRGAIVTTTDGINYNIITINTVENLRSIKYVKQLKKFIIVGDNGTLITTTDGINYTIQQNLVIGNKNLTSIAFNEANYHLYVGGNGIYESIDCENWRTVDNNISVYDMEYNGTTKHLIIAGNGIYYDNIIGTINEIQNITENSDLNFPLLVGENQLQSNMDEGKFLVRITYRQKYIGV